MPIYVKESLINLTSITLFVAPVLLSLWPDMYRCAACVQWLVVTALRPLHVYLSASYGHQCDEDTSPALPPLLGTTSSLHELPADKLTI